MTQEEQFVDTYLEHHGVKGMKWGVRKDDRGTSVKSRRRSIPVITDFSSDSKGVDEKVKDIATNMVTSGLARGLARTRDLLRRRFSVLFVTNLLYIET